MMEPLTANFRTGMRDTAQRLGIADFWRWWTAQLRALVPARLHNAIQRWRLKPVVVFAPAEAVIWELAPSGETIAYAPTARIPLQGDAAQVAQAGRAAMDALARRTRSGGSGAQVVIALSRQQVLTKRLTYPAAVETNLAHVLGYDLDRHTPFKSDDLYYDAVIVARDAARNEIRVELVSALKSVVDQMRRQVNGWGADVAAIVPETPRENAPPVTPERLNLLPEAERAVGRFRAWQVLVPIALAIGLLGAAIAIPILNKRDEAIALLHQTEQARIQATGADALRQQLDRSVEDYNYVLGRKYAYPSTLQLLEDVTRLLPDDTWLTTFELKSLARGKDPARKEILLRGESGNAGRLVTLLEESHLFEQAAPRSPTTKIQPGPGEIFDLGAQLRPLATPSSVPIGVATGAASAAGAPNPPGVANAAPRSAPNAPPSTAPTAPAPRAGAATPPAGAAPTTAVAPPSTPAAPPSATPPSPARPGTAATGSPPASSRPPVTRTAAATAPPPPMASPPTFGPVAPDGRTPGEGNP